MGVRIMDTTIHHDRERMFLSYDGFLILIDLNQRTKPGPCRPRRLGYLRKAKILRAHGGCLGTGSRRRTRQAAIICGEWQTHLDPQVSEWGNPAGVMPCYPALNQIGARGATGGTETSKYPEEEKSTEIARVAASESAPAQTRARVSGRRCRPGVAGRTSRSCPPWSGYKSGR